MDTKRCGHCGEFKPLDEFFNDKSRKDGKAHTCKLCMKEYADTHREDIARRSKDWYNNNRERHNSQTRQWKLDNRDQKLESDRAYRENNKEECNARTRKWMEANKPRVAKVQRAYHLKTKYNTTPDAIDEILKAQKGKCGACGYKFEEGDKICPDHCHGTKIIRGILCDNCNKAEGFLKTIENAEGLLAYMKKNELFYAARIT